MKTYEEMAQSALTRGNAIRNQKKKVRRTLEAITSLVACCVLLISIVFITVEAKEYNDAIKFFNELSLSTDGLSRDEIKAVYKDIATNSITYSKTADIIVTPSGTAVKKCFTLPVEEIALQISNSSIPVFVDQSSLSQSVEETYSRLQKSLINNRPGMLNIEENGMITYYAKDRNRGDHSLSYALSDPEAISVAENLLDEQGLLPSDNYRASVSKVQRINMDLSGGKGEVPDTIEYIVFFYRTHNGIDVLSEQEDGILLSFDAKGLTELRYFWREIDCNTDIKNVAKNILSISQATEIFKNEIDVGKSVVSSTDPNNYNRYVSVAYLQMADTVRPVYVFSTDTNYANSIFVDMYTGEVLNLT